MDWRDKIKDVEYINLCGKWYVRPAGTLGTCGFYPVPWELIQVSTMEAIKHAI